MATSIDTFMSTRVTGRLGGSDKRVLRQALESIGEENVARCLSDGVTLSQPDDFVSEVPSRMAVYQPKDRKLTIASSRFDTGTLIHEFGHTIDDSLEPDLDGKPVLRSHVDPELGKLYSNYVDRCKSRGWADRLWGSTQWSEYATTNVQEYLAEGVRLFATSSRSHQKLAKSDPALSSYIEQVLHIPSQRFTTANSFLG